MMVRNRVRLYNEEEDSMPTMMDHTGIAKNLEPGEKAFDMMVGHIETVLKSNLQKEK